MPPKAANDHTSRAAAGVLGHEGAGGSVQVPWLRFPERCTVAADAQAFITAALHPHALSRPSAEELLGHAWLQRVGT